ncbi:MAG: transcriptional repressor [Actinomycetota bacterium]|jgi:Fur family ferric uptake transcriptional regulator|nr:transcriptional repressor [Actinomycetota bacterium]
MGRSSAIAEQILEIMRRAARHCWTFDELQADLAHRGVAPNPSSIFRAVSSLEQTGAVVRVPLGDGRGHYEVFSDHHDHVVCDTCGRVEALGCSIVDDLASRVRASSGFVMSAHQLVLSGTCAACAGGRGDIPESVGHRPAARNARSAR